jgi:hypothetical protein
MLMITTYRLLGSQLIERGMNTFNPFVVSQNKQYYGLINMKEQVTGHHILDDNLCAWIGYKT